MKQSIVPLLACPAQHNTRRCHGSLTATRLAGLPLITHGDDIQEGGLRCLTCGTEYPILSGVAVLHPEPMDYLARYRDSILRDIDRHGELSATARGWIKLHCALDRRNEDYGADFRFSQQFEHPWDIAQALTPEPETFYGKFTEWLRSVNRQSPYDVLARWAAELPGNRNFALDAGCGGGGLVARLAPHYFQVFGLDLSFVAVLLARRAVLHLPEPERVYRLTVHRGKETERPLPTRRVENAEFVVGDCAALPFTPGLFDTVCSCNVIDMAGVEGPLRAATDALATDGRLLLTDPYFFRTQDAPTGDPSQTIRELLLRLGLRVEAEEDGVPWVWATYDRHWHVYFNDCVAARKPDAGR